MTAIEYIDSLIAGINMGSEIPVQLAELWKGMRRGQ